MAIMVSNGVKPKRTVHVVNLGLYDIHNCKLNYQSYSQCSAKNKGLALSSKLACQELLSCYWISGLMVSCNTL